MFSHGRVRGSPSRFCDYGANPGHNSSLATECKRISKKQRSLRNPQSQLLQEMYAPKYELYQSLITTITKNNAKESEHNNHKEKCKRIRTQQSQRTMQQNQNTKITAPAREQCSNQNTTITAPAREQCNRIRTQKSQLLLENNATESEHKNHSSC
jgi:hypothetical protein